MILDPFVQCFSQCSTRLAVDTGVVARGRASLQSQERDDTSTHDTYRLPRGHGEGPILTGPVQKASLKYSAKTGWTFSAVYFNIRIGGRIIKISQRGPNVLAILPFALWVVIALPFLLLLLVITIAAYGQYSLQRSIELASATACPKCGRAVGRAVVFAGKDRCFQKLAVKLQQNPRAMFSLVVEWEIACPHCGFRHYFYPDENKIETQSILANLPARAEPRGSVPLGVRTSPARGQ